METVLARYGFRFLYGIRSVTPFVLGMGGTPALRFAVLNAASGAVWALLIGGAGYDLGAALEALLGDLREIEAGIFAAIGFVGVIAWLWHARRSRPDPAGRSR